MVSFNKRSLDLHRFDKERHRLLGLKDLDTAMSHGGSVVLSIYESSLLCRDVCLMPKMKFGYDPMLNILLVTRCVISYCICLSGYRRGSIE